MRARGPQAAQEAATLAVSSAAAKRAYFATPLEPYQPLLSWRQQQLLGDQNGATSTGPEIVRVRCGNKIHRLRLSAHGGPAVLLDHPHLDRKAELALMALGAPLPDCLLVFDAITGRASHHRIRWRRRAYPIAARAAARRDCRRPGPRPSLDQPLLERYANFVRHRASLWLDILLPAGTNFEVLVIPPRAARSDLLEGPWSSRQRPGYSLPYRGVELQVHIPFDWCLSVERPFGTRMLETGFIVEARADRRGQMLQRLDCEVTRMSSYAYRRAWARRIEAIDSGEPVPARRWQRARRQGLIVLPDIRPNMSTGAHSQ